MAIRFFDNVRHAVTGTPGTGNVTPGAAPTSWQTLSAAGAADGDVTPVRFDDTGDAWELSYITLSSSLTVAARILVDSSTGSLLSLTSAATFTCVPLARGLESGLTLGGIGFTLNSSPDNGCVEFDSSTITDGALDYPLVAARHSAMVSGDDLILPDFRGLGLRGWDHGAGVDPDASSRTANWSGGPTGDNPGSEQADAFQGHWHQLRLVAGTAFDFESTNATSGSGRRAVAAGSGINVREEVTNGSDGTPRVTSETRGMNINVLFQMRLV